MTHAISTQGQCCEPSVLEHAQANSTAVREDGGDVLDDMVSAPKQIVVDYLNKHFPLTSSKLCDADIQGLIHLVPPTAKLRP